jgi:hypothetical protein
VNPRVAAAAWVIVALLMQAMFPVFALAAVVQQAPFFDAVICNAHPDAQGGSSAPASQPSASCAACCIATLNTALVPSTPEVASALDYYIAVDMPPQPRHDLLSCPVFTLAQPRAPPPVA